MDQSIAYKIVSRFKKDFKSSFIVNYFFKIYVLLSLLFKNSFIISGLMNKKDTGKIKITIINNKNNFIINFINKLINFISKYIDKIKNESMFLKYLNKIFEVNMESLFVDLSIIFVFFIHLKTIFDLVNKNSNLYILLIVVVLDILIIMQISFNKIEESIIINFLNYLSGCFKKNIKMKINIKNFILFFSSLILVILINKAGIFLFLKYIGGIIISYIILRYFEFGVIIFILAIPYLSDSSTIIILLLTVISGILKWFLNTKFKFKFNKYNDILIIFSLILLINTIFSINMSGSLRDFAMNILSVLLIIVMINNLKNREKLIKIMNFIIYASFFATVYGIYQYFAGVPMQSGWVDPNSNISIRVFSTFENPNLFAEYLLLVIPLSLIKVINEKGKNRFIFLFILLIQIIAMGLTFSRGGWLGLIILVAVFILLMKRDLIIKLIPFGLISLFFIPDSIIMRIKTIGDLSDSSNYYRFQIWQKAIEIIKDFFLTGVGLGFESFRAISNLYIKDFSPYHAHNTYLEIGIEIGIVGLIVFLMIIYKAFSDVKNQNDKNIKIYVVGLMSGILGLLVHGIAEHILYNPKIVFQFWITLALLISINVAERKDCDNNENFNVN